MPARYKDLGRIVLEDGQTGRLPFMLSAEQFDRWQAAGYDLPAALRRYAAFVGQWKTASDFKAASKLLSGYLHDETEAAVTEGVHADDPDLHLILRSGRAFQWDPPEPAGGGAL